MEIKPLFDRVLLTPHSEPVTHSLIATNEQEGNKMLVLELGTNNNFIVKKGDIVLINNFAGSEFIIENKKYILIKEIDILAIIGGTNEQQHS